MSHHIINCSSTKFDNPSLYATVTAVQGVHTPRCLLVTVNLHGRVRDNSCTVGAISFKKTWDALMLPN
jgi:hypothetical protein